jgi:hypothetical protein
MSLKDKHSGDYDDANALVNALSGGFVRSRARP